MSTARPDTTVGKPNDAIVTIVGAGRAGLACAIAAGHGPHGPRARIARTGDRRFLDFLIQVNAQLLRLRRICVLSLSEIREVLGQNMEFPTRVYLVAMFATITHRFPSVILAMALILTPGTHLVFSATASPASAAVSGAVPEGESLAMLCGHSSHGPNGIMSSSVGVLAAAPIPTAAPPRELPRADVAAPPFSKCLLAAKARGPPSA